MSISYVAVLIGVGLVMFILSILCYYRNWHSVGSVCFFCFKVAYALAFIMFIAWGVLMICSIPCVLFSL